MCLYLVCISLCVCARAIPMYVHVYLCLWVCVSVCVCVSVQSLTEAHWLAALGNTVHRGSPCWQEGIWKSYTDKPTFVLGLDRKGASVSRNRGEGIFGERNKYLRKGGERGLYRHVPPAHVSGEEELKGKARPRQEASETGRQLHFQQSLNLHLDYASEAK